MDPILEVIVNPASAGGGGARMVSRIEEGLGRRGVEFRLRRTESPGHATSLAHRAAEEGRERILAVGGDGTIHEIANGILAAGGGASLAVLPTGTGNDFYRMVGAPSDLDAALDTAARGVPRSFDVGLARWDGGERHFVNLFGIGIDVEVLRRREGFRRLPGLTQYLAALLSALVRFRPFAVEVEVEGERIRAEPTLLSAVTVGPSIGGGFLVSPTAVADDGLLDLCFVAAMSFGRVVRCIPRVIRGTHGDLDEVSLRRARTFRFRSADGRPFHFQFDGDLAPGTTAEVVVEIVPGALKVLVPSGSEAP